MRLEGNKRRKPAGTIYILIDDLRNHCLTFSNLRMFSSDDVTTKGDWLESCFNSGLGNVKEL